MAINFWILGFFLGLPTALADGQFDGRWSGALVATDSLTGCTGSTFPVVLDIRDGVVSGSLRLPLGKPRRLRGTVTPNGRIAVRAAAGDRLAAGATDTMTTLQISLAGTLVGARGAGAWSSNILGDCDGEFELRRR